MIEAMIKKIQSLLPIFFLLCLCVIGHPHFVRAQDSNQHVQIDIVPEFSYAVAGQEFRVGLIQNIRPNWHSYWFNAGDSGEGMSAQWYLPEGVSAPKLQWPTPYRIDVQGLVSYGYHDQAPVFAVFDIPVDYAQTEFSAQVDLSWLVCSDICIPEQGKYIISFPVKPAGSALPSADQSALSSFESVHPKVINAGLSYHVTDQDLFLDLPIKADFYTYTDQVIDVFPHQSGWIQSQAAMIEPQGKDYVRLHLMRDPSTKDLPKALSFTIRIGDKSFSINAKEDSSDVVNQDILGEFSFLSYVLILGSALLGGLLLNLMPCVFPVLTLKALSFSKLGTAQSHQARLYSLFYTAGVLVTLLAFATILIVLKQAGQQLGWGFQLQNPLMILGLVVLTFVIGLNLSGLFEFRSVCINMGASECDVKKAGRYYRDAFLTGLLAVVIATPCSAPFMAAALGFALAQPVFVALPVFVMLGVGLSLPFLLIGFIPVLRNKMPRPGAWMQKLREFLAFPMYITAVWLLWVLGQQSGLNAIIAVLGVLISIVFVCWVWRHVHSPILKKLSLMILISTLIWAIIPIVTKDHRQDMAWQAYRPDTLEQALQTDQPVFVDITADWCVTCKINEKLVLQHPEIQSLLSKNKVILIKGDWTKRNPEITLYLNKFKRSGVPLYVYYAAPVSGKRLDPVVLPQILTYSTIKKEFYK
jgi:thiol:disulfide interchange protein DsbD